MKRGIEYLDNFYHVVNGVCVKILNLKKNINEMTHLNTKKLNKLFSASSTTSSSDSRLLFDYNLIRHRSLLK